MALLCRDSQPHLNGNHQAPVNATQDVHDDSPSDTPVRSNGQSDVGNGLEGVDYGQVLAYSKKQAAPPNVDGSENDNVNGCDGFGHGLQSLEYFETEEPKLERHLPNQTEELLSQFRNAISPSVIPGLAPKMMAWWQPVDDSGYPEPDFPDERKYAPIPEPGDLFCDEGVAWVCPCGQYNPLMVARCLARDCSMGSSSPLIEIVNKWHVLLATGSENLSGDLKTHRGQIYAMRNRSWAKHAEFFDAKSRVFSTARKWKLTLGDLGGLKYEPRHVHILSVISKTGSLRR